VYLCYELDSDTFQTPTTCDIELEYLKVFYALGDLDSLFGEGEECEVTPLVYKSEETQEKLSSLGVLLVWEWFKQERILSF